MTARGGIEARVAARGAAAAAGANPALRSVVLDLCARHGARQILWIGPGGEPLGRALRQAGYAVWGTDPSANSPTAPTDDAPTPPTGATDLDPAPPPGVRFDLALSTESPESCVAFGARVAFAAGALRPGGLLLLPTPYRGSLTHRVSALYARWRSRHGRSRGDPSGSKPPLRPLLESHGFVLVEGVGVRDASWRLQTVVWVARQGRRPHRLNVRAERVDIQALLGHVNLATTQIDTHVDQDRMAAVVNKL
jgi:hypothetical protein